MVGTASEYLTYLIKRGGVRLRDVCAKRRMAELTSER